MSARKAGRKAGTYIFSTLLCGLIGLALLSGFSGEASAATYPAPVLNSAKMVDGNYVLNWSLPAGTSEVPSGGYDIWIDGQDSATRWRTTGTSQTISGLDPAVKHTFSVEARWYQATPAQFPRSATVTVETATAHPAPVLSTAKLENGSYVLSWSMPSNSNGTPAGGYDIWINGHDTNTTYRTTGTSRTISGLDTKANHRFLVEARWTQTSPYVFPRSNELTVNAAAATDPYPAPVLNSAKLENGSYVLSWSMPSNSNGTPAGGYDIWIDGHDTNTTYRTTGTSRTISGLDTRATHRFLVEARWTQASPYAYPRSKELTVSAAAGDTSAPAVSITGPSANTTITSAQTLNITANASDNVAVAKVDFYDGTHLIGSDTTSPYSASMAVAPANNGTHTLAAVAYDQAGNSKRSSAVSVVVNIAAAADSYPAPVLNSVKAEGTNMVLSWTMPQNSNGVPSGGYDIWIDGKDTNTTWRTTQNTAVISGLSPGLEHSFEVEARWVQANPYVFKKSNKLYGTIQADNPSETPPSASGPLRAFPGAEGFGANAKGGRGGKIIKVTNLNSSGTGSLRAALEASGPRIVVFEVSGQINLGSSAARVQNPYITVAGQTAPSPGITVQGGIDITTHDVVFQHLRVRAGASGPRDVFRLMGGSSASNSIYNIVIDHCSISWPGGDGDEIFSTVNHVRDVTISNCLLSETTNGATGALLVGNYTYNFTMVRNVLAHSNARVPRIDKDCSVAAVNNLTYNSSSSMFALGGTGSGTLISIVGNKFLYGPSTPAGKYFVTSYKSIEGTNKFYVEGNSYPSNGISSSAQKFVVGSPPVSYNNVTARDVQTLESYLLPRAGARPADRDPVDARVINSVQKRTGSIISRESEVGGFPSLAKNTRTLNLPANPNGDDDGDGYTNIEETLYQMAQQVQGNL
ncbi:MAG: Ig-like domain-containing protein [Syntrophotaleaceae bacterium]